MFFKNQIIKIRSTTLNWHNISCEEVLKKLKVNKDSGLSSSEVKRRREQFGRNILEDENKFNFLKKFIEQFSDFMVITLLIASIVSFVTSFVNKNNDYVDSIIILFIVVCNAIIGVSQESKAHKAIDELKKMSSSKATVIRNSKELKIPSEDIVPGDIMVFERGDKVCADVRLIKSQDLKVEESVLTGESESSLKNDNIISNDIHVLESTNMLFSGSFVTYGRGLGVAVSTSMNTQIGKIAKMINKAKSPQTPLQSKLSDMSKILGIGTIIICFFIFVMGIINKTPILEMFMLSISLAVAAIPEGLPAIISIALSNGVKKMAKNNVIIRKLQAVETLGSANVICTDKTGTLTQNKMEVSEIRNFEKKIPFDSTDANEIINLAVLCNNAKYVNGKIIGEPTEKAIIIHSKKFCKNNFNDIKRIKEVPFNSSLKYMMTTYKLQDKYRTILKGAPEVILKLCKKYIDISPKQINEDIRDKIINNYEAMASNALRVIAVSYFDHDEVNEKKDNIFVGLIGIIDPPREEVKKTVKDCIEAGIKPVMVTGDHVLTAKEIGKYLGIYTEGSKEITGKELNQMDQRTLEKNIFSYSIFARVSPEHKVKIVNAFQNRGAIVAMTGDGVNDAPALKKANIGCAMGTGTDVAKSASDMVLADDNFSSIVKAIKEGRGIYENIKKTIHFLISTNIGEIIAVFVSFLMNLPTPLLAIQLLWINLVTDSFPALALAIDPFDENIIKKRPKDFSEGFISGRTGYNMVIEGCFIGLICVISFLIGRNFFDVDYNDPIIGRTMSFMTIGLSQLAHAFNVRSKKSIFETGILGNMKLIIATIICTFLQVVVTFSSKLNILFKTDHLNFFQWTIVAILSTLPTVLSEFEKYFDKNKSLFSKISKNKSINRHKLLDK